MDGNLVVKHLIGLNFRKRQFIGDVRLEHFVCFLFMATDSSGLVIELSRVENIAWCTGIIPNERCPMCDQYLDDYFQAKKGSVRV